MSATSGWQELSYTANKDQVDALEDWLFAAGAISITLEDDADQPLLEPGQGETPLWDAVRLTAVTPRELEVASTRLAIGERLGAGSFGTVHAVTLDGERLALKPKLCLHVRRERSPQL